MRTDDEIDEMIATLRSQSDSFLKEADKYRKKASEATKPGIAQQYSRIAAELDDISSNLEAEVAALGWVLREPKTEDLGKTPSPSSVSQRLEEEFQTYYIEK